MRKFIVIRPSQYARAGEWFIAEDIHEPLFKCRMTSGPRGAHLTQISRVGIPFETLAPFIVEPGFEIPRSMIGKMSSQPLVDEVIKFQSDNEEIIEEELERRGREANPTLRNKNANDDS